MKSFVETALAILTARLYSFEAKILTSLLKVTIFVGNEKIKKHALNSASNGLL